MIKKGDPIVHSVKQEEAYNSRFGGGFSTNQTIDSENYITAEEITGLN